MHLSPFVLIHVGLQANSRVLTQTHQSLARALYSKAPVMILDNVLVGLDATTEKSIVESVFGTQGLIRLCSTTVILTTNSGK